MPLSPLFGGPAVISTGSDLKLTPAPDRSSTADSRSSTSRHRCELPPRVGPGGCGLAGVVHVLDHLHGLATAGLMRNEATFNSTPS
ncbi:MAG: hypothetical protein Ct9H300mP1_14480 [Planctomycetaceae bacterium]|nr:MAG: hypothetical protein Ct9H300mP1_14480 [Planctomycetaceae bacterium]